MRFEYTPTGICARAMAIEIDDEGKIVSTEIHGGCPGNHKGIISLIKGMDAKEAAERMKGITCGPRSTSCPDQLSILIEKALEEMGK